MYRTNACLIHFFLLLITNVIIVVPNMKAEQYKQYEGFPPRFNAG